MSKSSYRSLTKAKPSRNGHAKASLNGHAKVSRNGHAKVSRNGDGKPSVDGRPPRSDLYKLLAGFVGASIALDLLLPGAGRNVGNVLLAGVACALLIYSISRPSDSRTRVTLLTHDWAYLLSIGLMFASVIWSVAPLSSFLAAVPLFILWFCTILLSKVPIEEAVRLVLIAAIVSAFLSLAVIPIVGDLAYQPHSSTGEPELRGIFYHQLRLGSFMGLAAGFVVIAMLNRETERVLTKSFAVNMSFGGLLLLLFYMSHTRLYAGAAVLALGLTVLLSRRGSRKWIVIAIALILALPVVDSFGSILTKLEEAHFDTTLTGRTRTWTRALGAITDETQRLGYGFGTFKLPEFDYLFPGDYRPEHAHSSFIQAYFETGQIGLIILIALVIAQTMVAWRYSVRCNRYSYSLFLVLYNTIGSLTGLNYAGTLSAMFCFLMLFLAIESRAVPPPGTDLETVPMEKPRLTQRRYQVNSRKGFSNGLR